MVVLKKEIQEIVDRISNDLGMKFTEGFCMGPNELVDEPTWALFPQTEDLLYMFIGEVSQEVGFTYRGLSIPLSIHTKEEVEKITSDDNYVIGKHQSLLTKEVLTEIINKIKGYESI